MRQVQMTLRALKAECEEHESRTEGLHAKVDKLSDEDSAGPPSGKTPRFLTAKVIVTFVIAAVLIVAGLWLLTRSDLSNDVLKTHAPVIGSYAFVNESNGMRIWINSSDEVDLIVNVTVQVFAKAQGNDSYLWPPVFEKVYWVNQSSAEIADVIILSALPSGDYRISAFATDASGRDSGTIGQVEFKLL